MVPIHTNTTMCNPKNRTNIKLPAVLVCLVFVYSLLVVSTSVRATTEEKITWHSYDKGMALGKDQNKNVLINFYAAWCGYCRKMDKETFKNKAVTRYLNDNFIAIKVDTERENQIADAYNVEGLPSTWFVTGSGEKISNLPGFVPPELFMNLLRYIETESYRSMSFRKFLKRL